MSDSISRREEVLRMIITAGEVEPDLGYTHLYKVIENLPPTEPTGWIPFTRRPMTEDEQKYYPNCTFIFDCVLPDDGDEIKAV